MSDEKKLPSHKDPEFMRKWKENEGSWKDPEKARAAQAKSAATRRKRREAREKLQSGELLQEAAAAFTAENKDWLLGVITMYKEVMASADTDPKTKMQAAEQLTRMLGTVAPKKSEVKVDDKTSIDDTLDELKNAGVEIKGLNVIQGGKG